MEYSLKDLLQIAESNKRKIDGQWVPCRPLNLFIPRKRIRAAWRVLIGKADAVTWPGGQ